MSPISSSPGQWCTPARWPSSTAAPVPSCIVARTLSRSGSRISAKESHFPKKICISTLLGVHWVVMFCFWSFGYLLGSTVAAVSNQPNGWWNMSKMFTKYHNWVDVPQCTRFNILNSIFRPAHWRWSTAARWLSCTAARSSSRTDFRTPAIIKNTSYNAALQFSIKKIIIHCSFFVI